MVHLAGIVIMALVARGISFAVSDGQVLAWLGNILNNLPLSIAKPFGLCGRCAVSVWGTFALIAFGMVPELPYLLPLYWLAAAGLQDLIDP